MATGEDTVRGMTDPPEGVPGPPYSPPSHIWPIPPEDTLFPERGEAVAKPKQFKEIGWPQLSSRADTAVIPTEKQPGDDEDDGED